jgi:hypothetical protein
MLRQSKISEAKGSRPTSRAQRTWRTPLPHIGRSYPPYPVSFWQTRLRLLYFCVRPGFSGYVIPAFLPVSSLPWLCASLGPMAAGAVQNPQKKRTQRNSLCIVCMITKFTSKGYNTTSFYQQPTKLPLPHTSSPVPTLCKKSSEYP